MTDSQTHNPIVVALDVDTAEQALSLVERLRGIVGMFKIGNQLFTAAGPDLVRRILGMGERVFLDLKYHDIPNTVAMAAVEAARLGVSIFNLHTLGGSKMMSAAADAVKETVQRERMPRPLILGVTVLTSHTQDSLTEVGIEQNLEAEVVRLARLCAASRPTSPMRGGHTKRSRIWHITTISPGWQTATSSSHACGRCWIRPQSSRTPWWFWATVKSGVGAITHSVRSTARLVQQSVSPRNLKSASTEVSPSW